MSSLMIRGFFVSGKNPESSLKNLMKFFFIIRIFERQSILSVKLDQSCDIRQKKCLSQLDKDGDGGDMVS